jgi:hypothetical protein
MIIPEISDLYGKDTHFDLRILPDSQDFKYYSVMKDNIKVTFDPSKNTIIVKTPVPFELGVLVTDPTTHRKKFDVIREGYGITTFNFTLNKIDYSIAVGIALKVDSVKLFNTQGEELNDESEALSGMANLGIKRLTN